MHRFPCVDGVEHGSQVCRYHPRVRATKFGRWSLRPSRYYQPNELRAGSGSGEELDLSRLRDGLTVEREVRFD